MFYYALKTTITLILIVAAAEIAKRSTLMGGIVASIPIVSVLAMVWFYVDTQDTERVAMFAKSILWLILPSLSLFISLPILLNQGFNFWISLASSLILMFGCYLGMFYVLGHAGYDS